MVASIWELTKETIYLPLGCLQGGRRDSRLVEGIMPRRLPLPEGAPEKKRFPCVTNSNEGGQELQSMTQLDSPLETQQFLLHFPPGSNSGSPEETFWFDHFDNSSMLRRSRGMGPGFHPGGNPGAK